MYPVTGHKPLQTINIWMGLGNVGLDGRLVGQRVAYIYYGVLVTSSFELLFGLVALRFWPDLNENVDGMATGGVERPVTGESAIKEKKTT